MKKILISLFLFIISKGSDNNIKPLRIHFAENIVFTKKVPQEETFKEVVNRDSTYYPPSINAPFIIRGNVSNNAITLYTQEYLSLPIQLKNSIGNIIITSEDLRIVCGIQSPYKVKGCARSDTFEIYLDAIYRYGDLLHESIHDYSYQNDRVFSYEFDSIYTQEGRNVNVQVGNTHNIYEYFVSAYLYYLNNPSYLKQVCPQTYEYFLNC